MAIKRALISVFDKSGLVPFASELAAQGVEILSTGGTKRALEEAGLAVTSVSDVTGFPEILDGRVKTLHPNIHSGLLAIRDNEKHVQQLNKHDIQPIDLVVVNLYPFKETISKPGVTFEEAIENIDIGGPSMLRAAAKNHNDVTVVVDPVDYETVLVEMKEAGGTKKETRKKLAAKVFRHTAAYDALIAGYLNEQVDEKFPEQLTFTYEKKQDLRYGENPHQQAAFYREPLGGANSIANAEQLNGKELSYNNINDANAALRMIGEFSEPAAVAVKHMNPCGIGVGDTLFEAYGRAYEADPVSIFGGIVALNREVDANVAAKLKEIFLEIIIAPSFSQDALDLLTKKKNLRLLTVNMKNEAAHEDLLTAVRGGVLIQEEDRYGFDEAEITVPTKRKPTDDEWKALKLGWKAVKHVKSNAIVLANDKQTVGVGAGQMNRVGAAEIAVKQAKDRIGGAAMASDAFFPMDDTVEAAAKAGITAIIQPGGSIRDEDSIKKADEYGMTMVFTGVRHFKH